MRSVEKILRELIARPSVNPALLPAGDPRAGEKEVAQWLARLAAQTGLEVSWQEVFPNRSNLLVRLAPPGKIKQRLVLAPHLDTVGVASDAQFQPRKKAGRLYGRGACDTKGSVAVMFSALLDLAKSPRRPPGLEILFCALVDEEVGQGGSRRFVQSGMKADLAIVGEPTRLEIVTAHKGDLWLELEARGKAAHGSRPELGRNAIHQMAKIVHLLETDYARQLRRRRHPLLRHATINVGTISGGRQPNIVPDFCRIRIDRRTIPGEQDPRVKREILRYLRQRGLFATLVDTKEASPAPPLATDLRLPWVQQFLRAAGQTKPVGVDFFTDAGVLAAGGIPSVVFGPGDIAQAHTVDEWVALSQLERGQALLLRFLRSLA